MFIASIKAEMVLFNLEMIAEDCNSSEVSSTIEGLEGKSDIESAGGSVGAPLWSLHAKSANDWVI